MSSPSPKPSRWSRVGSAVRRSSTLLGPSRSTTPAPTEGSTTPPDGANGATAAPAGKDTSDTASIKSNKSTRSFASLASSLTRSNSKKKLKQSALDTTPQGLLSVNPATSALMVPSPIAESPNREASETEPAPPVGPSPLAQQATNVSEGPSKLESSEGSEMEPVDVESPSSLTGYVPPPLLDSSAGNPGAFTDDPDSLPQPTIVQDPYASHSQVNLAAANPATPPPETPERSTRGLEEEGESNRGTFFGEPVVESIASQSRSLSRDRRPLSETDRDVFSAAVEEHAAIVSPPEEPKDREMAGYGFGTGQAPASKHVEAQYGAEREATLPAYEVEAGLGSGHDVWGGKSDPALENHYLDSTPNTYPNTPLAPAPRIEVKHSDGIHHMPHPQPAPATTTTQVMPVESHRDEHPASAVFMPLPPFGSQKAFVDSQPLHRMPEASNVGYDVGGAIGTDETQPLLGNASNGSARGYGASSSAWAPLPNPHSRNNSVRFTGSYGNLSGNGSGNGNSIAGTGSRLHDLGWLEYHLPDGSFYYVHPTRRVTIDANLRDQPTLESVEAYLASPEFVFALPALELGDGATGGKGRPGVEIWVRKGGAKRRVRDAMKDLWGFAVVDHFARTVLVQQPEGKGKGKVPPKKAAGEPEEQLDLEYRYWAYMSSHPAHTALPAKAKSEALEVLTWSWTDRVLPGQAKVPPPFEVEECQEIMSVLKGFGDSPDDTGIQTRITARVLLRLCIWRQTYFRSSKPLPTDVSSSALGITSTSTQRRSTFGKVFGDLAVVVLCLGLPYLFIERAGSAGRGDWESRVGSVGGNAGRVGGVGLGGLVVLGVATCFVAAIVLSASITYLSLPEVDTSPMRIAGLCAVLFASFSMASTVVAFLKYKGEVGGVGLGAVGGFVGITKRAVIMSLPLVFLAYSIIGFIVAVMLYSYRGSSFVPPIPVLYTPEHASPAPPVAIASSGLSSGLKVGGLGGYGKWAAVGLVTAFGGLVAVRWATFVQKGGW